MKQIYLETIEDASMKDASRKKARMSMESFRQATEAIPGLWGIASRATRKSTEEFNNLLVTGALSTDTWDSIKLQLSIEFSQF